MTLPPYLSKGDTIGLVCPAGFMPPDKWQTCVGQLLEWGFQVKLGRTMNSESDNYFSGSDQERLDDLQEMLDNPQIKAVLCGRGGYGVGRIIDAINFKIFRKHPKWIIGFSDITVLHAHVNRQLKIATLHAPMAAAFNDGGFENEYVQSLRNAIEGKKASYTTAAHHLNKTGKATGRLVGGNLSLVAHLVGTPSAFKTKGRILFLEDVGEQLYNIDRMMFQLKRAGMLDDLAGLILGGFTEAKDTTRAFGQSVEDILHHIVNGYAYPICFNFPVSHDKENYALKVGGLYRLEVKNHMVTLQES